MANGKKGDHPLTDILTHGIIPYSKEINNLVVEIYNLGGKDFLDSLDWFGEFDNFNVNNEMILKLQRILTKKRDELKK